MENALFTKSVLLGIAIGMAIGLLVGLFLAGYWTRPLYGSLKKDSENAKKLLRDTELLHERAKKFLEECKAMTANFS